ncbi:silent information regulator protein Sir2 [candidate division KSB1 bacterium]|nr:silent information regulator protein Sir2 [candidate division KSB1 bacterium]RQW05194.1 MAG: silent information regulator protein Sir2 [candidate division KSB1 bacterium]
MLHFQPQIKFWCVPIFFTLLIASVSPSQVNESIDRGVVALTLEEGKVYVGWRLLKEDPHDVAFNVYRKDIGLTDFTKINREPITMSTNYIDRTATPGHGFLYKITAIVNKTEQESPGEAYVFTLTGNQPWYALKLADDITLKRVGIGDLDGDGAYDYVLQHPDFNVDPYYRPGYWKRSPESYKLDAYTSKGKFLWRHDMGWAIETGTWYSPYMVFDIDQDGLAEVYAKAGEGDPRELDGHVLQGPEYLIKLDGQSGEILAKREWISRDGYESYNYWSRNFLSVAYLDGLNPALIMQRGTYTLIQTVALNKNLQPIWHWASLGEYENYKGQGMHGILTGDIDLDGKDELVIGTAALDDNGIPMWRTGLGHNDAGYIADIAPDRPGYEIFYGIESRSPKNGVCLVDAKTGDIIWGYEGKTYHVHSQGMIGDLTEDYPGIECYAGEAKGGDKFFLYSAQGERLSDQNLWGLAPRAVWWDADAQKEICYQHKILEYNGEENLTIEGKVLIVADIIGDWREEILTSLPGELRIYSTNILADSKRVCLMQNHLYRMAVADASMGYYNAPQIGFK